MWSYLYVDDTIILSETFDKIQKALDALPNYCLMSKLDVNISKTKIIIFFRFKVGNISNGPWET